MRGRRDLLGRHLSDLLGVLEDQGELAAEALALLLGEGEPGQPGHMVDVDLHDP